jgi:hypothetical protein
MLFRELGAEAFHERNKVVAVGRKVGMFARIKGGVGGPFIRPEVMMETGSHRIHLCVL